MASPAGPPEGSPSYYVANHVAPALGSLLAQLLFLSPRAEVLAARERGTLGTLNAWPFVFIVTNCCGWLVYAVELRDWYVFASNLPGLLIGLWYVMQCLPLIPDRGERAKLEWATILSIGVWVTVGEVRALAFADVEDAGAVFAWMTICGLLLFYASPLATLSQVVRTRDSSSILAPLAMLSVVNGTCWAAYGTFAAKNFFIAAPNAAGVVLACVQLGMRALYPAKARVLVVPKGLEHAGHIALVPKVGADGVFRLESGEPGRYADGIAPSKSGEELLDARSSAGAEPGQRALAASPSAVELLPLAASEEDLRSVELAARAAIHSAEPGSGAVPPSTSDGSIGRLLEASTSSTNLLSAFKESSVVP